jgi:multiple sugar transport system substrate-binding protein
LPEALAYARFAAEQATQRAFALHHGQPARREVWEDAEINALFGGCYKDTRATVDACWIRPRYRGYLHFQEKAGDLVEAHLRGNVSEDALLAELQRLHAGG